MKQLAVALLSLTVLAAPLAARAQPGVKVPRVGWVWVGRSGWDSSEVAGFRRGLRELGYIEGENIVVEYRFGEGIPDRLPGLVGELLRLNVDVLVTLGTPVTRAAQRATTTVPIVSQTGDPVGSGFVASLARPGGNITGMTVQQGAEGLSGKWPELIKEAVPVVVRVAYLWNPANPPSAANFELVQRVALALSIKIHSFPVQRPSEFNGAFAQMASERVGALVVDPSPPMIADQTRLAELAMKHRSRRSPSSETSSPPEVSWPTGRVSLTSHGAWRTTWTRSSRVRSPPTSPSSNPRSLSWSSI
jgi:putative tryptophan/tyrosine transport system substrate-binding protein